MPSGPGRTLLLNGINVTAKELEQAVGRHAGNRKVGKVVWQHDPAIQKICDGWPQGIDSARSRALGFETDKDLDEVVRHFIADDLDEQMKIASRQPRRLPLARGLAAAAASASRSGDGARPPDVAGAHHVPALRLVVGAGDRAGILDIVGDADGVGVPRAGGLEDRRLGAVGAAARATCPTAMKSM